MFILLFQRCGSDTTLKTGFSVRWVWVITKEKMQCIIIKDLKEEDEEDQGCVLHFPIKGESVPQLE